jgi:UDP-glucose 4-epimerase
MRGVDFVFHAAALKQVPSCEFYPLEAVRTNVLGTENVLNAAVEEGVRKAILLSTDKAVYPVNAMGQSKALAEKLMLAKARALNESDTIICGTRYGNVMASRGSVIPLFIKQIKENRPLTVTDPGMTRFLMSLDDAVDLVLHAFENGGQGDIFVQKSPASTILDLAEALKQLFHASTPVKVIGTRHGEKLYETLLTREELAKSIDQGEYYRIPSDQRDLNYNKYVVEGEQVISCLDDYNSHNTERLHVQEIMRLLLRLDYVREELYEDSLQPLNS